VSFFLVVTGLLLVLAALGPLFAGIFLATRPPRREELDGPGSAGHR
jgi:hypothetical protein